MPIKAVAEVVSIHSSPVENEPGLFYRLMVLGSQLPTGKRRKIYGLIFLFFLAVIWLPVWLTTQMKAPTYTSRWTLVLPGTGAGHAINLDSLGQASASNASPFTSGRLDPAVNYREIAQSGDVIAAAAATLNLPTEQFGKPRIRLIDQTSLMHFELKAETPELAQRKSLALHQAFEYVLETLRNDELNKINQATLTALNDFNSKLQDAQQQTVAYQNKSGIVAVDQFHQMVTQREVNRNEIAEQSATLAQLKGEIKMLTLTLSLEETEVKDALLLRNSPDFQIHLAQHANLHSQIHQLENSLGTNHPTLLKLETAHDETTAALKVRGRSLLGKSLPLTDLMRLGATELPMELVHKLAARMVQLQGIKSGLTQRESWQAELEQHIAQASVDVIKLEELARKQQVATAVFSTALAKQDMGKVDRYASYPLVQLLSPPSKPDQPDRLSSKIALVSGCFATFCLIMGLALLWVRKSILQKLLKNK